MKPTIDDIIKIQGEPDDIIVCDPTRGNESDGVVLIYNSGGTDDKGYIYYDGYTIPTDSITDITVKNIAMAYLPNDYSLLVSTTDKQHRTLRIHVGTDASTAEAVCEQLIASLH